MLGKIDEIIDNTVTIRLAIDISTQPSLINLHVVFEDGGKRKVVGQIVNCTLTIMTVNIVGESREGVLLAPDWGIIIGNSENLYDQSYHIWHV